MTLNMDTVKCNLYVIKCTRKTLYLPAHFVGQQAEQVGPN